MARWVYYLFVRPPPALIPDIAGLRDRARPRCPVSDQRLHVTIARLASFAEPCPHMQRMVEASLHDRLLPGGALCFDRMDSNAVAATLRARAGGDGLRALRRMIPRLLPWADLPVTHLNPEHRSHLTLGYHPAWRGRDAAAPVAWEADEVLLVESAVGRTTHTVLARWPLQPPPRQGLFAF